jgi:hypothetical protein
VASRFYDMFLRNVVWFLTDYRALYTRRYSSSKLKCRQTFRTKDGRLGTEFVLITLEKFCWLNVSISNNYTDTDLQIDYRKSGILLSVPTSHWCVQGYESLRMMQMSVYTKIMLTISWKELQKILRNVKPDKQWQLIVFYFTELSSATKLEWQLKTAVLFLTVQWLTNLT